MRFYKLINDTSFIGVATSRNMVKYQPKHNAYVMCGESDAMYIICNDKLYRSCWLVPEYHTGVGELVELLEITQDEYDILSRAVAEHQEISVNTDIGIDSSEAEIVVDDSSHLTIEYVRQSKLEFFSEMCRHKIEDGFDLMLSDGAIHHFSLTTQDQLNLLSLSALVSSGTESIPYHADGELCRYYSLQDMSLILSAATNHKTYHVSYHNSLKNWVNALSSIKEIDIIQYGDSVPTEYCSAVLIDLNERI